MTDRRIDVPIAPDVEAARELLARHDRVKVEHWALWVWLKQEPMSPIRAVKELLHMGMGTPADLAEVVDGLIATVLVEVDGEEEGCRVFVLSSAMRAALLEREAASRRARRAQRTDAIERPRGLHAVPNAPERGGEDDSDDDKTKP
jgi:hypothetical protein